MAPRHLTSHVTQRTSKALSIAVLAIGLAASTFVPASALAAPARDDMADLVLTYDKKFDVTPSISGPRGSRSGGIRAVVKNIGSAPTEPVELRVVFPPQVMGRNLSSMGSHIWKCDPFERVEATRNRTMTCRTDALKPGESATLSMEGLFIEDGDFWIQAAVDPQGLIPESDESNNVLEVTF